MSAQFLPGAVSATVTEEKIRDYLLNLNHPNGQSKARFFLDRGFSPAVWPTFANALRQQAQVNPIAEIKVEVWGTRYVVDCHCPTPDGKNPCIRTVWQVEPGKPTPRLLTAHPKSK